MDPKAPEDKIDDPARPCHLAEASMKEIGVKEMDPEAPEDRIDVKEINIKASEDEIIAEASEDKFGFKEIGV